MVVTSFYATSQWRPMALAIVTFTGLAEYVTYLAVSATAIQGSVLADSVVCYVRLMGSFLAVASVVIMTVRAFFLGKPLIDPEEERFMRYIVKYLAQSKTV